MSYNKIEPIGKHYANQWGEEDLSHQMKEGSRFADLDSGKPAHLKRKADHLNEKSSHKDKKSAQILDQSLQSLNKTQQKNDSLSYGPLTQRLISALIEQNLMTPFDNELADYLEKIGPPQSMYMSPRSMAKKFTFNTSSNSHLERKIKKTLIEQGILDSDETDKGDGSSESDSNVKKEPHSYSDSVDKEDEIGNEIRNLQNELRTVTHQCELTLEQLLATSKKRLEKQEIKKKILGIDFEVYFSKLN